MANVNVTYDDMRNAATQLTQGKDEITQKLTELSQLVDNLVSSGYVTDQSSRAFDDTFDQFITGTKSAVEALDGLSKFLLAAADGLQQTDEQLANSIKG